MRYNKIYIFNWYFSNCNFVCYCIDSILENWWPEIDKLSQNYMLSVKERVIFTVYSYFPMMRISSRWICNVGDGDCNWQIIVTNMTALNHCIQNIVVGWLTLTRNKNHQRRFVDLNASNASYLAWSKSHQKYHLCK